jgi:hypothetical protein
MSDDHFFIWAGARSILLMRQAFAEEGIDDPVVDERMAPANLLYPRSFVEAVNEMPGDKLYDYSFMGSLYRPETFEARKWILDFARQRFTDRSYLLLSESPPAHTRLGSFDHTGQPGSAEDVFVPKDHEWLDRGRFHPRYFEVMRASQFTLCPAGDHPWSMRFHEAVMCRSIPIVSDLKHAGRNRAERSIGYTAYLREDDHVYSEEITERNYELFLRHQTLIIS